MNVTTNYVWMDSPVGKLLVAGDEQGLRYVLFGEGRDDVQPRPEWCECPEALKDATRQLSEYFEGRRHTFDLRLAPEGTAFQQRVWHALRAIPYGETVSYGELARRIGSPNASRAVGLANGANPISIIIPCHRVIGGDGKLTGYGGGLPAKEWLIGMEKGRVIAGLESGQKTNRPGSTV